MVLSLKPGPNTFQRTDGKDRRLVTPAVADEEIEIVGPPVSGIESAQRGPADQNAPGVRPAKHMPERPKERTRQHPVR
jgi:hypothetical protein